MAEKCQGTGTAHTWGAWRYDRRKNTSTRKCSSCPDSQTMRGNAKK